MCCIQLTQYYSWQKAVRFFSVECKYCHTISCRVNFWLIHNLYMNDNNNHKAKKRKEKKNCFTGGHTCQVGSVGWTFLILFCFVFLLTIFFYFISGSKNDSKNTKIFGEKNLTFFAEKSWEKLWLLFKKFQLKFVCLNGSFFLESRHMCVPKQNLSTPRSN